MPAAVKTDLARQLPDQPDLDAVASRDVVMGLALSDPDLHLLPLMHIQLDWLFGIFETCRARLPSSRDLARSMVRRSISSGTTGQRSNLPAIIPVVYRLLGHYVCPGDFEQDGSGDRD